MSNYITGYRFKVQFIFSNLKSSESVDVGFQTIKGMGLKIDIDNENTGENVVPFDAPTKTSYNNITLVRGFTNSSMLTEWIRVSIALNGRIPIPVVISALDKKGNPNVSWFLFNAFPISWDINNFESMDSKILFESITLGYETMSQYSMAGKSMDSILNNGY